MESVTVSMAVNPWMACAFGAALRLVGLGAAWSWVLPDPPLVRTPTPARWILSTARAALIGTLLSVLVTFALAELGLYRAPVEVTVLVLLAATGLALGWNRPETDLKAHLAEALPGLLVTTGVFAAVMLLPARGEWIAGGWDPGIYVGQGVMVERSGTFYPEPEPFFASLSDQDRGLFTRQVHGFTEYLPVVPIDPDTGGIQHFFFRLTPSCIALLSRCGGLRAASRVNLFLGYLAIVLFAGMLIANRQSAGRWLTAALFLGIHPVWVFMMHFPTSEMLQAVLIFGLALLLPYRFQCRAAPLLMAWVLFAAMLNRFSFFPFGGLFLCAMTWMDLPRPYRDPALRTRILLAAALTLGAMVDFFCCRVTIVRLDELAPLLLVCGFATCALAIALEFAALVPRCRRLLARPGFGVMTGLLGLVVAGSLAAEQLQLPWKLFQISDNLRAAWPYLGTAWIAAGCAGWLILLRTHEGNRTLPGLLLFLTSAALVTFGVDAISSLYPWAMRRHLVYTLPALILLAALLIGAAWDVERHRKPFRLLALVGGLLLAGSTAHLARAAAMHTEFNGLSTVLEQVSAQIDPDDLVICDHFRWGTPLRLLHGKQVLNGEIWWQDGDEEGTKRALDVLAADRKPAQRILFFTSTDKGLEVFPHPVAPADALWDSGPVIITELRHRFKQRGFVPLSKGKHFRLYEWKPDPVADHDE